MAADHSTARTADPVTGSFCRFSPDIPAQGGLAGGSKARRPRRRSDSRTERLERAPISAPCRHDGPEVAQCLGELVAEIRKKLPLRPDEAAYRAWISRGYWHAIEQGKRLPSLAVFIMLARSLGMDPRELLDTLLERLHYGRGAPPVFQGPPHGTLTEAEREYQRLMAAARSFSKVTEATVSRA